jgi:hypothetical protein
MSEDEEVVFEVKRFYIVTSRVLLGYVHSDLCYDVTLCGPVGGCYDVGVTNSPLPKALKMEALGSSEPLVFTIKSIRLRILLGRSYPRE